LNSLLNNRAITDEPGTRISTTDGHGFTRIIKRSAFMDHFTHLVNDPKPTLSVFIGVIHGFQNPTAEFRMKP
jgi:hypothetical protein